MNDIEQLCKRLIILDEGKIMYDGETELLKQKFIHEKVIEVEFHDDGNIIQGIPGVTVVREQGCKTWLTFDNDNYGIGDVIGTIASRYEIKDISVNEPSVESIIRNIYNNSVTLATPSEESLNKCDES